MFLIYFYFYIDHFRSEICYNSCRSVCKNEIFVGVPMVVVANIISRLKYEIYMPEDCITTPGFLGEAMYFILHGSVRVYSPSGKEVSKRSISLHVHIYAHMFASFWLIGIAAYFGHWIQFEIQPF